MNYHRRRLSQQAVQHCEFCYRSYRILVPSVGRLMREFGHPMTTPMPPPQSFMDGYQNENGNNDDDNGNENDNAEGGDNEGNENEGNDNEGDGDDGSQDNWPDDANNNGGFGPQ